MAVCLLKLLELKRFTSTTPQPFCYFYLQSLCLPGLFSLSLYQISVTIQITYVHIAYMAKCVNFLFKNLILQHI